jgi:hypothetical protein
MFTSRIDATTINLLLLIFAFLLGLRSLCFIRKKRRLVLEAEEKMVHLKNTSIDGISFVVLLLPLALPTKI